MKRTTVNINSCKINNEIRFSGSEISDSSKISIGLRCSLGLNGKISMYEAVIAKNSLVRFYLIDASNNGEFSLGRISITDGSVLLFEYCEFIEDSRITMDGLYLAKNARLEFNNNIINGGILSFKGAKLHGRVVFRETPLPKYIDFRNVEIGDYDVDFSWVRPASEGKKIKIALWGSDIEKIKLNTHFEIWFPEEGEVGYKLTSDDRNTFLVDCWQNIKAKITTIFLNISKKRARS